MLLFYMIDAALDSVSQVRRSTQQMAMREALDRHAIADSDVDDPQLRAFADRLEALRSECGCRVGEITTIVGTVALVPFWVSGIWLGSLSSLAIGATATVTVIITSALMGKLLGITVARVRYRVLRRRVARIVRGSTQLSEGL